MNASTHIYKFAEFTLNSVKRKIFQNDKEIDLGDKDFEVLLYLIENRPNILSHDKIIKSVWDGAFVENNAVEKAVSSIRNVLGDDFRKPLYVKTVRGKGYFFVSDVEEIIDETQTPTQTSEENRIHNSNKDKKNPQKSKWLKVAISILFLSGIASLIWWKSENVWESMNSDVIFADDFSGNEIDLQKWKVRGKSVRVADGIVKITVEEDDNWGWLTSNYIDFDPNKKLTIRSRMKVSFSRNIKDKVYFVGDFGIVPKNDLFRPNKIDDRDVLFYGVKYANYDYESKYDMETFNTKTDVKKEDMISMKAEGFFLVREGGRPHNITSFRRGEVGSWMEPVWDKWFEQKLVYSPQDKKMTYFVDGGKRGEFAVGKIPLPLGENQIRLEILPWAWYLHHSIEIDYIEITQ